MSRLVQVKNLRNLKIVDVKQFNSNERDRPEFSSRFLKIIYFLRFEGIVSTLRKYSAHKSPQPRYLTFLTIDFDSNRYINISTQFQTDANKFVISNQFYKYVDIDLKEVANRIDYYLNEFNQFADINNLQIFNVDDSHFITLDVIPNEFPATKYDEGLFIYGLGGYVRMFIMHHFAKFTKVACVDYKANVTDKFASKYGFNYGFIVSDDSFPLLEKVKKPVAIIASYHADHAPLAFKIFHRNPNTFIFIEKPPTVTLDDLSKLIELYNKGAKIEIGFNRRFIGYSQYVRRMVKGQIVTITCSIKEVKINPNHWYLWKNQGTRLTGNCVHWFDLGNFWTGSTPTEINLMSNPNDSECFAISVLYDNGSILNITGSDKGNSLRGVQERIEIRYGDDTIFIDDFISLTHIKSNGIKARKRNFFRDKGHEAMYKNFKEIINNKKNSEYSVVDLINTSVVTFYATTMLKKNIRNLRIGDEVQKYIRCVSDSNKNKLTSN